MVEKYPDAPVTNSVRIVKDPMGLTGKSDSLLMILRALGDEIRLRILQAVLERPRNVTELVRVLDVSQPDVSHHLRRLREAGLVEGRKKGRETWYGLIENPSREARLLLNGLREVWGLERVTQRGRAGGEPLPGRKPPPRSGDLEDYLL